MNSIYKLKGDWTQYIDLGRVICIEPQTFEAQTGIIEITFMYGEKIKVIKGYSYGDYGAETDFNSMVKELLTAWEWQTEIRPPTVKITPPDRITRENSPDYKM